jgi:hypothetical protein
MTSKSWEDRMLGKLRALRAQAKADGEWFDELCRYTDRWDPVSNREGLERDDKEGVATKLYADQPVYTVRVNEGQTIVHPVGGKDENYSDREHALDRMAELVARAINDANWGKVPVRAAQQPRQPLYPA